MDRLTLAEISRLRGLPGRAIALFITDRCPVGCAHCSVSSRRDSPTIIDFERFSAILDGLCANEELSLVGITGGEPFVERRGLIEATEKLARAGKDLVLYTSGVWAVPAVPSWVEDVLRRARCVFLSTDAFHAKSVDDGRFVRAAQTIADEGAWIIVQVLNRPQMVERAEKLLQDAFGPNYRDHAEFSLTEPLAYGRGESLFILPAPSTMGSAFGACSLLAAPLVRYDGVISACCNEQVIMGKGPSRLRRTCRSAEDVAEALALFRSDALLNAIGSVGAGAVTQHPRFTDFAERKFGSICELCWELQERADGLGDRSDGSLNAIGVLAHGVRR